MRCLAMGVSNQGEVASFSRRTHSPSHPTGLKNKTNPIDRAVHSTEALSQRKFAGNFSCCPSGVVGLSAQHTCTGTANKQRTTHHTVCKKAPTQNSRQPHSPTHSKIILSRPRSSKHDAMSSTSSSVMSQSSKFLECDRTHKPKKEHHVLVCLWFDCAIVQGLPKAIHSEPSITQRASGVSLQTPHTRGRGINRKQCAEAYDKLTIITTCNETRREKAWVSCQPS